MKLKKIIKDINDQTLFRGRRWRRLALLKGLRGTATALAIFATMIAFVCQTTTALPASSFLQTASPSPAAQTKPNIADEVGDKGQKELAKPTDTTRQTPSRRRGANNSGGYNGGAGNRQPAYGSLIEVTFTTDVPDAEIFLNRGGLRTQKLGNTDANGKLTYRLARGRHSIAASRIGLPIQRQDIDVQSGNTSFAFKLSPATTDAAANADAPANAKDKDSDSTAKNPTPASDDAAATTNSRAVPAADDLLNRYLDPKDSNLTTSDWERLQTQAKAGLEKEPDNAQLKAQALLAQGQLAYLRKDYPSALVALNKASLQPATLEAPINYALGNAYLATNQSMQAIKAFRRAIEAKQDLAIAYKGIGDAYTQQGKSKDAANSYEQARKFGGSNNSSTASAGSDNSSAGNNNLSAAHALMKSGRWSQALKELSDVAKTQPSADVYTDMGDCYYELKQPLSASQAYLKATELDPKSALAFYKHGIVMYEQREYAQAMESMERALALDQTGSNINRVKARDIANKSEKKVRKQS